MNGIVIRLAGVRQPETKLYSQPEITIGTSPDCDLWIATDDDRLPTSSQLLTISHSSGVYRLTMIDPAAQVTRHGETVAIGDPIHDGDTFYFGETGIRLRIFALSEQMELADSLQLGTAVLAHARQAELAVRNVEGQPVAATPRTDVAIVFVKQLLRELINEIPRRILYAALGIFVLVIGTIVYVNTLSILEGRRNNRAIKDIEQKIGAVGDDMSRLRTDVQSANERSAFVLNALSMAPSIVSNYGQSVTLIYGTYSFVDPRAGREARFKEPSESNNPIGPGGTVNLSTDGNGPVYEVEFIGTGFLVAKGMVLTNRHVVQPWVDDPIASMIRSQGFQPRLKELSGYFPKAPQPFALKQVEVNAARDLALCSFDQGLTELPVLPLDETGEGAISGQLVVLLGYPGGIEGLMARSSEGDRLGSSARRGASLQMILNELSTREQISPQSTQGHLSDITTTRIVYDAQTGEGGSGGPVFGANGKVIGVNQAMLPGTPSNFGIPIRYGLELLRKHVPEQAASASQGGAVMAPTSQ